MILALALIAAQFRGDYLIHDIEKKVTETGHWRGEAVAFDPGSLVKPFLAAEWAKAHGSRFPVQDCTPADHCWRPKGHGSLGIEQALAQSCNTNFGKLSPGPHPPMTASELIRGFADLVQRTGQPGVPAILRGMAESARTGTAKALRGGVLAKTGTAHCPRDPGDGLVVVIFPVVAPRFIVLARVHGTTGAVAANQLAPLIAELRSGR